MTVAEDNLGFSRPIQVEKTTWFSGFHDALCGSGAGFLLSDTALDARWWADYRVLVVATFDYLDESTQTALVAYARAGGVLVVGPEMPYLNARMDSCTILADAASGGVGRIVVVDDLASVATVLGIELEAAGVSRVAKSAASIDVVVHKDLADAARRVVFVCNPTEEALLARVGIGDQIVEARDLWADAAIPLDKGDLVMDLPPHTITIADLTLRR